MALAIPAPAPKVASGDEAVPAPPGGTGGADRMPPGGAANLAGAGFDPLVRLRNVSVQYGPLQALDGVDLDIHRGEIVALAGENGAGKSTLVRCIAGDIAPDAGQVWLNGRKVGADPRGTARLGVAVVWQDLALCDNLDVASNLLLGGESRKMVFSDTHGHTRARELLAELGIPLTDTTAAVGTLSGGQRQLVAVARAMRDRPHLLVLDEPTAALGVAESIQVEELTATLPSQGTAVLLVSHDVEQMFRLANRIVVLRRGRVAAEVDPEHSHPDEVAGLLSGQPVDVSPRRQLDRLHNLADQLASAAPSSSLSLILSALGAALGGASLCIHVREGSVLHLAGMASLPRSLALAWRTVPIGLAGGQVGRAAASGREVVSAEVPSAPSWARLRREARMAGVHSSWSVPFTSASGVTGVITVLGREAGSPSRDELDLVTLYAGYAAGALERDRLLAELTARNQVLETIRDVLETLAGPIPIADGLVVALRALREGLGADEVGLLTIRPGGHATWRACVGQGAQPGPPSHQLAESAWAALESRQPELRSTRAEPSPGKAGASHGWRLAVGFAAPDGNTALAALSHGGRSADDQRALIEDGAHSLSLALEREASEQTRREAMALRSTQELQRQFLSRLSHELRTPLTAIRGYASSLLQPDVRWDSSSEDRFLVRISEESARLGRLVDDLLDFSAIDAGILRLQPDWCDLRLVLEAARACVPGAGPQQVELRCAPDLPVIWADHDRLEQVFVNLLDNAVRHNPPGTSVVVDAAAAPAGQVAVSVTDDGSGVPDAVVAAGFAARGERRRRGSGAGLGLSIAKGIVDAHGGCMAIDRLAIGTRFVVELPVANGAPSGELAADW
ncbi:MAG: ATP-binding cassette domain-containing protein [Acidimicrobiales bacterium]